MLNYMTADGLFRRMFGGKTYKLALGCSDSCPNRNADGSGGCIFCGNSGSGDFAEICMTADEVYGAIERAKSRVAAKVGTDARYIAYFQSFTSTYAPVKRLERVFRAAADREDIVALSVATRPDCLGGEILGLFRNLVKRKPLFVELGLQTANEHTAALINRRYPLEVYDEAVRRLHECGANVITHTIIGLPGESAEDAVRTAAYAGRVTDGIKLHLLFVTDGTKLAEMYRRGEYAPLTPDRYADILCRCIKALPDGVVIHRLTGDPPKSVLLAPAWTADKKRTLAFVSEKLTEQGIRRLT